MCHEGGTLAGRLRATTEQCLAPGDACGVQVDAHERMWRAGPSFECGLAKGFHGRLQDASIPAGWFDKNVPRGVRPSVEDPRGVRPSVEDTANLADDDADVGGGGKVLAELMAVVGCWWFGVCGAGGFE